MAVGVLFDSLTAPCPDFGSVVRRRNIVKAIVEGFDFVLLVFLPQFLDMASMEKEENYESTNKGDPIALLLVLIMTS